MIQDSKLQKATSRILQRSERQIDLEKLLASFVDVGIISQLDNNNNQIFYGRRGTGKTHVLKVLLARLRENANPVVVYIDSRTLGSTSQFSDPTVPMPTRCLCLFRDILAPIHDALLERVVESPPCDSDRAFDAIYRLADTITQPHKIYVETELKHKNKIESAHGMSVSTTLSTTPKAEINGALSDRSSDEFERSYHIESKYKIVFPALHDALTEALELVGTNLFILLDEWSSLPYDIQPLLAEFLKRGVLPVQRATIKIAALEQRSHFTLFEKDNPCGFEVGADIATAPDLDDYYVFDRNPDRLTTVYASMLLRHLELELPDNYLQNQYKVANGDDLASRIFTERATFIELSRAAEGVIRDLINIFTQAFFHAQRRGRDTIDRKAVVEGARQWFEQDKQTHMDDEMQKTLRSIVDEVIGTRKARSFLLARELQRHPMILKLVDARVLHQMQRGYADKDNPGLRYNIYSLDYGTYVDLLGTSRQPDVDLSEDNGGGDVIVPFDDKRSIRRIVLNAEILANVGTSKTIPDVFL